MSMTGVLHFNGGSVVSDRIEAIKNRDPVDRDSDYATLARGASLLCRIV